MKTVLFSFLTLSLFLLNSCSADAQKWGRSIKGEGPVVEKTYDMDDFSGLGLGISANVYIKKGNSNTVTIKGQENILENIKMEVDDESLNLEFDRNVGDAEPITVYLEMDDITALAIGGSGDIKVEDRFMELGSVELAIGGSGSIELVGSARSVELSVAGSGDMKCGDLETDRAEVNIAGSGDVTIHVNNDLEVNIVGSGDVRYKGNPKVESNIVGSGDVRAM